MVLDAIADGVFLILRVGPCSVGVACLGGELIVRGGGGGGRIVESRKVEARSLGVASTVVGGDSSVATT